MNITPELANKFAPGAPRSHLVRRLELPRRLWQDARPHALRSRSFRSGHSSDLLVQANTGQVQGS
ncbi:hypothetical protein GCM10009647_019520 [Streptomyces sanglieri]